MSLLTLLYSVFALGAWILPFLTLWRIATENERIGDALEDAATVLGYPAPGDG